MRTKLALFITRSKKYIKDNSFVAIYYLLLLSICFFFHYRNTLNADEGVILNGAWHLFNNYNLYFDFFEMISPGSFYFIFWGFKIFGPHYYVANILSLLMLWGISIGIFKISKGIKNNIYLTFLVPIIFIISLLFDPIINHNLYNLFFIVWACYFIIEGLKKNKNQYFIWGGVFSGLSIVFLQQKGIIFLGATLLFLLTNIIRNKFASYKYFFLYLFFSLLPITLILIKWPIKLLYYNLIKFPSLNYWEVNRTSFLLLMIITLFFLYYFLILKNKSKAINYLFFIQFFLLLSVVPLPDTYHVLLIIFPLLILTPILFTKTGLINKIVSISFLSFLVIPFFINIINFKPFYFFPRDFISFIKEECPGKYIYAGPFSPNIYFETKKINATSFGLLIERYSTTENFNKALEEIKRNQPSCAILHYYNNVGDKFKHRGCNVIEEYINEKYKIKKTYNNNQIIIYSNQ